MSDTHEMEQRVLVLEELVSHQEHLLRELNRTVFELRGELDRLELGYRRQQERIESLTDARTRDDAPANDPPPHY